MVPSCKKASTHTEHSYKKVLFLVIVLAFFLRGVFHIGEGFYPFIPLRVLVSAFQLWNSVLHYQDETQASPTSRQGEKEQKIKKDLNFLLFCALLSLIYFELTRVRKRADWFLCSYLFYIITSLGVTFRLSFWVSTLLGALLPSLPSLSWSN